MAEINEKLLEDVRKVAALPLPWEQLDHKQILISGASGMIGSFLIHVLMERKEDIRVIALGRSEAKAKAALGKYWERENFRFLSHDTVSYTHLDVYKRQVPDIRVLSLRQQHHHS